MAALTRAARGRPRPPAVGEGRAIAALWRQLWEAHEGWGGYPGSRSADVYEQVARRLDDEARVRAGRPILGGHLHLVADVGGDPCAQVEGWFDPGTTDAAPATCEVRSLVVAEEARRFGLGRALLDALGETVRARLQGGRCVLVAEVLEPNPARAFYDRVGFSPVAWNAYVDTGAVPSIPPDPRFAARLAVPDDAPAIGRLEGVLAARRRAAGDPRPTFAPPVGSISLLAVAAKLAHEPLAGDLGTIVATDRERGVVGAASIEVQALEPPFEPLRRGLVGRFAIDPGGPQAQILTSLVALGVRMTASRGASRVEVTDLSAPGTEPYDAVLAAGARPWSRVIVRQA